MTRIGFSGLSLMAALLASLSLAAQTTADLPPEKIEKIEEIIATEMARNNIPGLSVAIVVDSKIRYANGFGMADLENHIPAKTGTVYRIASITKSMTEVAVMQLAERGQLVLDAPVQNYCPAYPEKPWPITVRQLVEHKAGIRHYKDQTEASGTRHFDTIEDALVLFKDDPLLFEPGTEESYTTYGYQVLGCAIENSSQMSYEKYIHENIFLPAGMENTRADDAYAIIPNRARGYAKIDYRKPGSGIRNASLHDTSMKLAGGGLVSNVIDLANFAIALNADKLLKTETLERLDWGTREFGGQPAETHYGTQTGGTGVLVRLPEKEFAIVVLINMKWIWLDTIVAKIGRLWGHFQGEQKELNKS